MTPVLSRKFSFAENLGWTWGKSRSDSMGERSITVPGATAFLEWKFINNAGLDYKKNSPVSQSTALSKGQAISLKSQKNTYYQTQARIIILLLFFFFCLVVDSWLRTMEAATSKRAHLKNCRSRPKLPGSWCTKIMMGLHAKELSGFFVFSKNAICSSRLTTKCEKIKSRCATA